MVKQDQQSRPNVPTNPDRSCTYLVLRAHRMRHPTSKTRPRVSTRGPRSLLSSDQHSKEHWPGGVKIKMTLGFATPRKSYRLLGKCRTKVGPCWRSFIQSELSRGPHNTQPRKECKIKEHNTGMTETTAARVEQNTRHKAEPSTLYQVYRCIEVNKR